MYISTGKFTSTVHSKTYNTHTCTSTVNIRLFEMIDLRRHPEIQSGSVQGSRLRHLAWDSRIFASTLQCKYYFGHWRAPKIANLTLFNHCNLRAMSVLPRIKCHYLGCQSAQLCTTVPGNKHYYKKNYRLFIKWECLTNRLLGWSAAEVTRRDPDAASSLGLEVNVCPLIGCTSWTQLNDASS